MNYTAPDTMRDSLLAEDRSAWKNLVIGGLCSMHEVCRSFPCTFFVRPLFRFPVDDVLTFPISKQLNLAFEAFATLHPASIIIQQFI